MTKAALEVNYKRKKSYRKNGESDLSLNSLEFPTQDEVRGKIDKKLGKMPDLPDDLPTGEWSEQALRVLSERYLKKDNQSEIVETPEQMCWRVSWDIASAEVVWGATKKQVVKRAREFYHLLITHEFLPNSPTLMNAGTRNNLQYSACFVLPVADSLEGIFDSVKHQALIHQSGGGTGFSYSRLRPKGAVVRSSGGVASGPVSFMRVFDAATNEIKQGGKRRGANMGILRVDHPDILEFIHCKEEGGITNFNISVGVTDKFMEAYKKDEDYDLIDPKTKEVVGKLNAREVFDEIAKGAWSTGDPGLVFLDRMNKGSANPVPPLGPVEATNPCGEQPLYPYDACNLGSIFLTYFIKEEGDEKSVDWEKLEKTVLLAVRFLDNVVEVNPFPLSQIRQTVLAVRRIGLGIGGWADMLIELGIAYDSEEALDLADKVMKKIQQTAVAATQKLAEERGPFPLWPVSIYKNQKPRRNSTVTTIAPTGSISIIANSSSGIEPLFAIAFQHIVKDKHLDRTLNFVNPRFEEMATEEGIWSEELRAKVAEHGVVRDIEELPAKVRAVFGTAHEIHQDWHIKMQASFQRSTENAVSKTINLENSTSVEEIKQAYLLAWETDCKGITVFRDGSKDAQVLNLGVKGEKSEEVEIKTIERPFKVSGATYKLSTPVGTAFITINQDEQGNPLELFINVGKAGSDVAAMAEALGRTISTSLRFTGGLSAKERAIETSKQLSGIGGRRSVGFGPNKVLSLPDAVGVALGTHFGFKVNGNGDTSPKQEGGLSAPIVNSDEEVVGRSKSLNLFAKSEGAVGDICPSCGASALVYEEGCSKCYVCGHSEC